MSEIYNEHLPLSYLESLGFIGDTYAGIQYDMNVVYRKKETDEIVLPQIHLCDHNCRSEYGGYDCPAAFTLDANKRPNKGSIAPLDIIMKRIDVALKGLEQLRPLYIEKLTEAGYPQEIVSYIEEHSKKIEVNLFGGNPEMYPQIAELIAMLKQRGVIVNLTTTGKRFFSSQFTESICRAKPDVIALSADDLPESIDDIYAFALMGTEELKAVYKKINPLAGQKQKAIEAMHVANLSNYRDDFPPIIFNLVIHPGNIDRAYELIKALKVLYPKAKINPYPAQSAFLHDPTVFTEDNIKKFENIIDMMLASYLNNEEMLVPRMHYWLLLKAMYLAYPHNWQVIAKYLSGYDAWQCYHDPILSGRYIQIGASNNPMKQHADGSFPPPGGHLGCFWNQDTITDHAHQVWRIKPMSIRKHISVRMQERAQQSINPCPGCLMHRLVFDEPSLRAGISDPIIRDKYLQLRKMMVAF